MTSNSNQLDLFAEVEAAEATARAQDAVSARIAAGGDEVIDIDTLASLCREDAARLEARDRDDQRRFGWSRASFQVEADRLRGLAGWLQQREGGRVPVERAGWPCPRCDAEPGAMCGAHGDGEPFVHVGRGFLIGFTSPGAGDTTADTPGPDATPTAPRCVVTCEDGPGGAWRGRCLGCGWRGPIRTEENTAVEDGHDHAFPGWREVPVVDPAPHAESPRDQRLTRWTQRVEQTVTAVMGPDWLPAGGPIRTRRDRPASRHVPGRAHGGGYDLSAPSAAVTDR